MTRLRSLVQETGAGVLLVSHLKRPDGNKGHEEGQRTTLAQLRGSAAIGQLSDIVIGLERDLQDEDSKNITTIRCLKNRFSGVTGVCCNLRFDPDTGRMSEAVDLFDSNKDGGKF
jgi:twinkle protein